MLKKVFVLLLSLAAFSSPALAKISYTKGAPYLGGALGIQNRHGYNGLFAQAFGGMNVLFCQRFYLAGELFFDTGSIPISQKRFDRTTYGFGASVLPGFLMYESTLVYGRAGIATFRYNKTNDYSTGGQLGLGLQTSLWPNWDIRGEYVYTGEGIIQNFGAGRFNFFILGLLYKFS